MAAEMETNRRPLIAAATLLGIGLGGFADGIVFHQLLQFHSMLSGQEYYPRTGLAPEVIVVNMEINMFWDGLFHVFTWVMTVTGLAMLWRAGEREDVPWSRKTLVGGLSLGWGLFNLVEGIIDHHILHIHHVTETPNHFIWDLTFLASGLLLCVVGVFLIQKARYDQIAHKTKVN